MKRSIRLNKSLLVYFGIALILIAFVFYASAVYRYGNYNLMGSPHRVFYGGYRYDNQGTYVILTGEMRPQIEVSSLTDKIVGKRIYSYDKDYIGNERAVFLHI